MSTEMERVDPRRLAALIADHIERFPEKYDQHQWGDGGSTATAQAVVAGASCGTPACVAGWAVRLCAESVPMPMGKRVDTVARQLLALDTDWESRDDGCSDDEWLFDPDRDPAVMPAILRHYASTGVVDRSLESEVTL